MTSSISGKLDYIVEGPLDYTYFNRHRRQGTFTAIKHLMRKTGNPYESEWTALRHTLTELEWQHDEAPSKHF